MPVDPEIHRLAADPEVVATLNIIDSYFKFLTERVDNESVLADFTAEDLVEYCWSLLKRGILRFQDEGDDDDAPFVQLAMNPGQRTRARLIGGKLYAVRQRLRRTARRAHRSTGSPWRPLKRRG